jgi:two-component system nitrogen regulation sensor histidine kinase NtrY
VASNERLAEERARIAAVVDNVAAGVISIHASGRIFTCNEAALAMLRQDAREVVGKRYREAWEGPRGKLAELLARDPGGSGQRTEELHLTLGGEWRILEVTLTAMVDTAGQESGRVLVIEDLTELAKAQQLAAWNEAARRIAHEIKNPLTPIRLAAERLLHRYRQGDPELGRMLEEAVETIVREVGSMQGMVDEFSRFARMPRPRPEEVDLARLIADILDLYRDIKPGVQLCGRVDETAARAWLDGEQFRRALINLLDNALEATDPPGRIDVEAVRADGHLEVRVADTGRGIPEALRGKLFLPHFSTKGRGTGLGLAIVHRIVSDHRGSIRVEDNRPRGTVFTLELPLP